VLEQVAKLYQGNLLYYNGSNLLEAIKWLADEASHHASIDTFAKKLYFRKQDDALKKLKITLSAYLIAEQQRNHVDLRYDSFFASICEFDDDNNLVRLPPNLHILTWNYDAQLEKAFYGFCDNDEYVLKNITHNRRQIHRINGCCGHILPYKEDEYLNTVWKVEKNKGWEAAIKLYKTYMDVNKSPDICFAWEKEQNPNSLALDGLDDVSVLVLIGYSFPYFNRQVDEKIFDKFGKNLRKVYVQCLEDAYEGIKGRLVRLLPERPNLTHARRIQDLDKTIIQIKDTDSFYIPDEL
jgi:hypothetical protein